MNIDKVFEKVMYELMLRVSVELQNELRQACPVRTGLLRISIKVRPTEDGSGLIISMLHYGKYVEFGTNPYTITPKNKKALAFSVNGDPVVVARVRHPGIRPNPFIRTTIRTKLPKIILNELSKLS